MDVLGEGFDPGVHLDELDVVEDLVHLLHSSVGDGGALPPEVRRQSGAEHLNTTYGSKHLHRWEDQRLHHR